MRKLSHVMRGPRLLLGLIVAISAASPLAASAQDFTTWLEGVRREAIEQGIRGQTLDAALSGVKPIPRVIELDRHQPEFTLTFRQYVDRVAPESRIRRGRRLLAENRALLTAIGRKYRVQPRFLVALWGIESDFGRIAGGFKVVAALATLAHDGRRSAYFRGELFNALRIIDQGHVTPDTMMGSWAGAMGPFQFMPSSFLAFAADHDGDGRRDIWTTRGDMFASAANYLARSGWHDDLTWGREVLLPAGFDRSLLGLAATKPLPEWQALGVRRADGGDLPIRPVQASVIEAEAHRSPAYLVYQNYRTVLKWNRSTFFALAVGLLADGIGRR